MKGTAMENFNVTMWNVSKVTSFDNMFRKAGIVGNGSDSDLSKWDTSKATKFK